MPASSYQDPVAVSTQVNSLKHRKNLLLWYTADEPDGPGDPLTATRAAYDLIYELDGYHPVSIALNCADHFFEDYVSGADIILPDVYMIGNNVTFSTKYNTPCTKYFGCCGCDNCEGRFEDISKRLDETRTRLRVLGWEKTKFIWAVTQAFGGEEYASLLLSCFEGIFIGDADSGSDRRQEGNGWHRRYSASIMGLEVIIYFIFQ